MFSRSFSGFLVMKFMLKCSMLKYHGDTDWNENKPSMRPLKSAHNGCVYFHVFHGISGEVPVHSTYPTK